MAEGPDRPSGFPWGALPAALLVYAVGTAFLGSWPGLPLDDGYIYQRYAANLAQGRGLAFNPGERSFGVTSPLWALILAAFRRGVPSFDGPLAAQSLGLVLGVWWVVAAQRLLQALSGSRLLGWIGGVTLAGAPHLLMQSLSGMETSAALLALNGVWLHRRRHADRRPVRQGFLLGILGLLRPELMGIALGVLAVDGRRALKDGGRAAGRRLLRLALGWLVPVLPFASYLALHTGRLLPTTFHGKKLASLAGIDGWTLSQRVVHTIALGGHGLYNAVRAVDFWWVPGEISLVGMAYGAYRLAWGWRRLREAEEETVPWLLSLTLALPALFAAFLPVHPHDGGYFQRYYAPMLVALPLLGWLGLWRLLGRLGMGKAWRERGLGWLFLAGLAANAGSLPRKVEGLARDYRRLVAQNQALRRPLARQIAAQLPPDARLLVGKSGLGTIGYYADRYVKDEGALINPDIFPYYESVQLQGEEGRWRALRRYLIDQRLGYWVSLPEDRRPVFAPEELTPLLTVTLSDADVWEGLSQLVVYRFRPNPAP